jgi:CheY-like chemotaxis protein
MFFVSGHPSGFTSDGEHNYPSTMALKILLIEDEQIFRCAMTSFLEEIGHQIIWAQDAPGAIELLKNEEGIGLIILDIMLANGTTGWSVAEFRHYNERVKDIPLVIMSATDPAEILARARENWLEGVTLMLGKPPDVDQLERYIASLGGS